MPGDPNKLFQEAMTAINAGDYHGARHTLLKVNGLAPGNADVLSYLGFAEASLGMPEGLAKTAKAAEALPESPQILMNHAFALSQSGHQARAIEVLRKADRASPNQIPILNQLSRLLVEAGAFAEAEPFTRALVEKAPKEPVFANRHVKVLTALEKGEAALEFVEGLGLPEGRFLTELKARAARAAQNWPLSYKLYKKLSEEDPTSLPFKRGLAHSLMGLEDFSTLVPVLKEIRALDPENQQVIYSMAYALFHDHRHEECLPFVEQILAVAPDHLNALLIKGRSLVYFGELEEAEKIFHRVLELSPEHPMAVMQLTKIRRPTKRDETFDKLEEMEKTLVDENDYRALMGLTLGEMYEGIKDYDKAFYYFKKGNQNAMQKFADQGFKFSGDKIIRDFQELRDFFPRSTLQKLKGVGVKSEVPIFIVSMPRSGTTLLEQIVSSHSNVFGAGELPLGQAAYTKLKANIGKPTPELIASTLEERASVYADFYLDLLPERPGSENYVTDKMPNNFSNLGFLQTLFPRGKFLHIRRNPLDVCLSIYKGFFNKSFTYALRLEDLGFYYRQYYQLMEYWRKALALPLYELSYEELVADPESEGKKVLEHCNLEWEPGCLEFHKRKNKVITMSAIQVREPVHQKAIDKWRRYEKHLDPLLKGLGEEIVGGLDI